MEGYTTVAHLTPLQRLLPVNYRDSVHCLLCMPKIFQLYISVYFAPILGVFEAHADMKRQQIRRKSFSLLLKSVKITAVNELNTNGVKLITVQFSEITLHSIVQLKM